MTAALVVGLPVLGGAVGQPAVQAVIPSRAVIGVNTALVQVGAVGIIIGTGIGVQGVMPGQKAVAVGDIVLQLPVGFARKVRLVTGAYTPAHAVHAVVALGVYHVAGRVGVEILTFNGVYADMDIFGCAGGVPVGIYIIQPAVRVRNGSNKLAVHGRRILHIRV